MSLWRHAFIFQIPSTQQQIQRLDSRFSALLRPPTYMSVFAREIQQKAAQTFLKYLFSGKSTQPVLAKIPVENNK